MPLVALKGHRREDLAPMFATLGFKEGAEVGVRRGQFAEVFCKNIKGLHMTCIDPWAPYSNYTKTRQDRYFDITKKRLEPYNVTFIRKTSMEALADVPDNSLDFVHIDGDHSFDYVCPDIIFWTKKLKSHGVMICHDYYRFRWAGVVDAVDAYTSCHAIIPWFMIKHREPTVFWLKPEN